MKLPRMVGRKSPKREPAAGKRTIDSKGATGVGIASIVAAGTGLLVTVVAARTLGIDLNREFIVFWGTLFSVFGILSGVQGEATRAVGSNRLAVSSQPPSAPRQALVLEAGLLAGALLAVLIALSSPMWAPRLLPTGTPWLVAVLCISAVLYSGHAAMAGAAGGRQDWSLYSLLMGTEATARFAVATVVALLIRSLVGVEAACAAGIFVWLGFAFLHPRGRENRHARADVPLPRLLRNTGLAMLSSASTSGLIVGFPILLQLTSASASSIAMAPLLLAVQFTRAPIMIPLQAFQGVAIAVFLEHRSAGLRALAKPFLLILIVGGAGALLAAAVGPTVMLIFGPAYVVSPIVLGSLTFAAGLMAALTLSGTATLALGAHRSYLAGWLTATLVTLGLLLVPGDIYAKTIASLTVGPMVGIVVHAVSIRTLSRRPGPPSAAPTSPAKEDSA